VGRPRCTSKTSGSALETGLPFRKELAHRYPSGDDCVKIIFSRKGVDSKAGGCASPILDGQPISLPIPTSMPTPIRYGDLAEPMPTMASDLSRGRLSRDKPCHLDPDIIDQAVLTIPRLPGWRGALGQAGLALSHLRNAEVGPYDIFLFWGLYRPCRWTKIGWLYAGPRRHGIFGWLQVDDVVDLGPDGRTLWQDTHGWSDTLMCVRVGPSRMQSSLPGKS